MDRVYFVIDLKTFYASVECIERGLNPLEELEYHLEDYRKKQHNK